MESQGNFSVRKSGNHVLFCKILEIFESKKWIFKNFLPQSHKNTRLQQNIITYLFELRHPVPNQILTNQLVLHMKNTEIMSQWGQNILNYFCNPKVFVRDFDSIWQNVIINKSWAGKNIQFISFKNRGCLYSKGCLNWNKYGMYVLETCGTCQTLYWLIWHECQKSLHNHMSSFSLALWEHVVGQSQFPV